jgi:uncharacterized protein (DUF1330 family)
MGKGYVYVEIEVHDADNYRAHYMTRSGPAVAAFGGRFVVRGGAAVVKTGPDVRRVLVEFESLAQALAFYDSPQYQEAIVHRDRWSTCLRYVVMEGAA